MKDSNQHRAEVLAVGGPIELTTGHKQELRVSMGLWVRLLPLSSSSTTQTDSYFVLIDSLSSVGPLSSLLLPLPRLRQRGCCRRAVLLARRRPFRSTY
jgi:hypothetical protein